MTRGERPIRLTRTEFSLLELFLRHPRQVLDRARILEQVWGYDFPTTANSLEVYVGYLRRKTEAAASRGCCTRSAGSATRCARRRRDRAGRRSDDPYAGRGGRSAGWPCEPGSSVLAAVGRRPGRRC